LKHLPNAITVLRVALIPLQAWLLLERDYALAFALFVASGLSDLADGFIARRWNLRTRFGAIADPLADKLTMLTVVLLLAMQGWLPWWFAALVIGRDLVIVAGAVAYHWVVGHVEMAPSWLSKLNTALEFAFLASVLAFGAGYLDEGAWYRPFLTSATIVTSFATEIDVLNRVEQFDALLHRLLERLAPGDQPHAAGALVDHRGAHGFGQVALALRFAARVDQPGAAHVAVGDLIAAQVDRVVGGQLAVDLGVRLAELEAL
jgi:cardiolipin synthase (CMP-forming)